jgi:hypothetical protein
METRDLWPENFQEPDSQAPVSILREQARLLGQKTQNLIEAEVRSEPLLVKKTQNLIEAVVHSETLASLLVGTEGFLHTLYLVVPALEHYRYRLLRVEHQVEPLYPVTIYAEDFRTATASCNTSEDFLDQLGIILGSDRTRRILRSLMAQMAA